MSARTALQDMKDGKFVRKDATHRTKIVEPELNRYHLYISMACPWANGCLAALKMKGLEDVIGWSNTHPTWQKTRPHDENDVSKLVWCVYHCPTLIAHCIHTPLASSSFACRRVTVGGASGRRAMRLWQMGMVKGHSRVMSSVAMATLSTTPEASVTFMSSQSRTRANTQLLCSGTRRISTRTVRVLYSTRTRTRSPILCSTKVRRRFNKICTVTTYVSSLLLGNLCFIQYTV